MGRQLSWVLTGIALFSTWLLTHHRRSGWAIGVGMQVLWAIYAVVTHQWGFLVGAAFFGWLDVQGWRRWGAYSPDAETDHLVHEGSR
jgi:hypothetical protein